jgi:biopolymer transport protein ExbB
MGVLLLLSLIAGYVFIQRLLVVRRAGKEDESFMNRIKDYIHEGKLDSAINLCRRNYTPSARMIEKGISRLGRPMHDVQIAIENVGNLEVAKLEKGLPLIATVAAGAPMIGFLGTVTGMVRAFFDMANAGTNVDVTLLSSGIYEALVTTVGGLVVGIIALFAYNYLVTQVDNAVNKMEARTMEFMDLLNEPANK